jgi:cyclophilin family peptidyl-prolyl cis-trans isomerase
MKSILFIALIALVACNPRVAEGIRKKDLGKQVLLHTTMGDIRLKLYTETPKHRYNFIRLVKTKFYDSVLFHRVINQFMIQSGDPDSRRAGKDQPLGEGDVSYTVPAEFNAGYFHRKGVLAAARTGDDVNPARASSGAQFYIVQGKKFTDAGLDSVENVRLKGRKIPAGQREIYKTVGGTPQLDQAYTIFGEVVSGMPVVDAIAGVKTTDDDRPLEPVRIIKASLVKP